jgi:hypothetical protein
VHAIAAPGVHWRACASAVEYAWILASHVFRALPHAVNTANETTSIADRMEPPSRRYIGCGSAMTHPSGRNRFSHLEHLVDGVQLGVRAGGTVT